MPRYSMAREGTCHGQAMTQILHIKGEAVDTTCDNTLPILNYPCIVGDQLVVTLIWALNLFDRAVGSQLNQSHLTLRCSVCNWLLKTSFKSEHLSPQL